MESKAKAIETIEIAEAHKLLELLKERKEKVALFLGESDYVFLSIEKIFEKNIILALDVGAPNPFLLGQTYVLQFEYNGSTYTGPAYLEKNNVALTLRYERAIKVMNRRSDFRMPPPDQVNYYVLIKSVDGKKLDQKLKFFDMSLGGTKALVPSGLDLQQFVVNAIVKGQLICQQDTFEFTGIIRSLSKKHLGIQFTDLGTNGKNLVWNELMGWYRHRKTRYTA
jgi:hypothetical protein